MDILSQLSLDNLSVYFGKISFDKPLKFKQVNFPTIITFSQGSRFSLIVIDENGFSRYLLGDGSGDSKRQVYATPGSMIAGECLEFNSESLFILSSDIDVSKANTSDKDDSLSKLFSKATDLDSAKKKFPNQKGIISRFE